jgi:hypothetical protein
MPIARIEQAVQDHALRAITISLGVALMVLTLTLTLGGGERGVREQLDGFAWGETEGGEGEDEGAFFAQEAEDTVVRFFDALINKNNTQMVISVSVHGSCASSEIKGSTYA